MNRIVIALLGCFLFISSPVCTAQNSSQDQQAASFINNMYNGERFEDYSFLQNHCTRKMLKKLVDNYEYECDGTCYATWLFRSGAQDEKYDGGATRIINVVAKDDHWYAYTALDMGWKFTNWIYLIKSGNTFLIDDVITVNSELDEDF